MQQPKINIDLCVFLFIKLIGVCDKEDVILYKELRMITFNIAC